MLFRPETHPQITNQLQRLIEVVRNGLSCFESRVQSDHRTNWIAAFIYERRNSMNNGLRTGVIFFAPLLSRVRVSRTSCSPRACPRLPEKRKKMTPVLQATIKVNSYWMLSELTIKATVSPAESDSDDDDIM